MGGWVGGRLGVYISGRVSEWMIRWVGKSMLE